jgi:hypothetical protein
MTLWINNGKDGKPNTIAGDIDASASRIEFTEAVYRLDDSGNFGALTYVNVSSTDCKPGSGAVDLKAGDIVQLKFTIKDYETEYQGTKKTKKTSEKQQLWHEILTKQMSQGEAFSGFISLAENAMILKCLATGKDQNGVEMAKGMLDMFKQGSCALSPVPLNLLKDLPVSSSGGGKGKGSYQQSELARLTDRYQFLKQFEIDEQVALAKTDKLSYIFAFNLKSDTF